MVSSHLAQPTMIRAYTPWRGDSKYMMDHYHQHTGNRRSKVMIVNMNIDKLFTIERTFDNNSNNNIHSNIDGIVIDVAVKNSNHSHRCFPNLEYPINKSCWIWKPTNQFEGIKFGRSYRQHVTSRHPYRPINHIKKHPSFAIAISQTGQPTHTHT